GLAKADLAAVLASRARPEHQASLRAALERAALERSPGARAGPARRSEVPVTAAAKPGWTRGSLPEPPSTKRSCPSRPAEARLSTPADCPYPPLEQRRLAWAHLT